MKKIKRNIRIFHNGMGRIFRALPRKVRIGLVYLLLLSAVSGLVSPKEKIVYVEKEQEPIVITITENAEVAVVEPITCELNSIECEFRAEALAQGLTEEQAYLIMAISRHETGHWTSSAFKELHNLGGIMGTNGLRAYSSQKEGIKDMVRILKNYYFDLGLNTIEEIGAKYCPVGAENDPQGLNKYWVSGVTNILNYYYGK